MVQVVVEMPEDALSAMRKNPGDFGREMRIAAAVKWYELKLVSQERAARIAGLSRVEFLEALSRFDVSPFQYGTEELLEEADRA